jgi:hypothetical protein
MNVVTEQKTTVQRCNVGMQWKNALKLYNNNKINSKVNWNFNFNETRQLLSPQTTRLVRLNDLFVVDKVALGQVYS